MLATRARIPLYDDTGKIIQVLRGSGYTTAVDAPSPGDNWQDAGVGSFFTPTRAGNKAIFVVTFTGEANYYYEKINYSSARFGNWRIFWYYTNHSDVISYFNPKRVQEANQIGRRHNVIAESSPSYLPIQLKSVCVIESYVKVIHATLQLSRYDPDPPDPTSNASSSKCMFTLGYSWQMMEVT